MLQNLRFFFRTHHKQLRTAGVFFLLGLAYTKTIAKKGSLDKE